MNSSSNKWFSSVQEDKIAKFLGWRVVAGSGAFAGTPGDVESDEWLGECKTHRSNSCSIYFAREVWNKIKEEAISKRKYPVLFADDGSQSGKSTWCLCLSHSVDTTGVHIKPYSRSIRTNISFSHPEYIESIRHEKRVLSEEERIKPFAYSCKWEDDEILMMPLEDFGRLIQ